jgi:pentatricopeptide repeat protein
MTAELTILLDQFHREDSFDAAFRLIAALRKDGRAEDAIELLNSMLRRDLPARWNCQFAVCALELGLYETCIGLFERGMPAMTADSDRMAGMADLAAAKFACGRYHEAHPLYRTLRQRRWMAVRCVYSGNEDYWWKGFGDRLLYDQPVDGRRIMVVHDEGGYGDLFQLVRYVDELRREGASRVYLVAPRSVMDLVATKSGVDVVDGLLPQSDWDLFCPGLSLFARYQTSPFAPHWDGGYLSANSGAPPPIEALAALTQRPNRPKVGLVWRSATTARHEPFRSMPLSVLAPILEYDGVDWISLQVDVGSDDEVALLAQFDVKPIGQLLHAFVDTAHVLQHLDLLVSIDSAPVHLAGALGRPVWALLAKAADHRWYDDAKFTPWYSSVRLFRQDRLGDWANVIEDLSREIRAL